MSKNDSSTINFGEHINIPNIIVSLNFSNKDIISSIQDISLSDETILNKDNNFKRITIKSNRFSNLSPELKIFVNNAYQMMTTNGFSCNKNKLFIEFQEYNLDGLIDKYSVFTWHYDDNAAHNFKCNTMIIYLNKDESLNGGNFLYYYDGKYKKIFVKNNTIVMCSGRLVHTPEILSGIGKRKSIVIQFERI